MTRVNEVDVILSLHPSLPSLFFVHKKKRSLTKLRSVIIFVETIKINQCLINLAHSYSFKFAINDRHPHLISVKHIHAKILMCDNYND